MFALAMSKSSRRLCSALAKEQTQSLENVQRRALQIIFFATVRVVCRLVHFKGRHCVTGVVNSVSRRLDK